jgi:hypothetical protein
VTYPHNIGEFEDQIIVFAGISCDVEQAHLKHKKHLTNLKKYFFYLKKNGGNHMTYKACCDLKEYV